MWVLSDGMVHGKIPLSGKRGRVHLCSLLSWLFTPGLQGVRPQPYSCPQVASSEACLTALGPCSLCLGGGEVRQNWGNLGLTLDNGCVWL